jgi:rare lipoprotein A
MFQMRANIVAMGVIGAALLLPELAQAEQVGHASWYALYSRTASGEMMNPSAMTAAHRSLPFGTKVLVENLNNGKTVIVRINDRGPFIAGRIIDVSKAAASSLGMLGSGTARVRVSASGGGSSKVAAKAESPVKVARTSDGETAKMEGASDSKPASASRGKSTKTASVPRGKSTRTAKAYSKSTKVASAGKRSVKVEKRSVAGLMKSTQDLKRVASRASSRKGYAVVARPGPSKSIVLASSANPYGAFVRSASFVN